MADAGLTFLLISGLMLVGIFGFLAMAFVLVGKFIGFLFGAASGGRSRRAPIRHRPPPRLTQGIVCPHARCANVNLKGARFCARCGRPLRSAYDADLYG